MLGITWRVGVCVRECNSGDCSRELEHSNVALIIQLMANHVMEVWWRSLSE